MGGYWTAWSRSLQGYTPTARLVAAELALLADQKGVAMVPLKHLALTTGRTPRAVREALANLSETGRLRRDPALNPGHPFRATRFQLVAADPVEPPAPAEPYRPRADKEAYARTQQDGRNLRALIEACVAADWHPPATYELATLIERQGRARFNGIITRRRQQGIVTDPWDTLTVAWEVARQHSNAILSARNSWGMWTHLTSIACAKEDKEALATILVGRESALEALGSQPVPNDDRAVTAYGVDDFDDSLLRLVLLLMSASVPEAIAWAGTARILELGATGASRRHWLAARDAKLQALGLDEQAARTWMTLLVGSRRGTEGFLKSGMGEDSVRLAASIGFSLRGQAFKHAHDPVQPRSKAGV